MSSWIKHFLCACTLEVSLCTECQQKEFTDVKQKMCEWGVWGGGTVADLRGGARDAPPLAQNFFIFMQFLGKIGQIIGQHAHLLG